MARRIGEQGGRAEVAARPFADGAGAGVAVQALARPRASADAARVTARAAQEVREPGTGDLDLGVANHRPIARGAIRYGREILNKPYDPDGAAGPRA